jgi:hypothetical protein
MGMIPKCATLLCNSKLVKKGFPRWDGTLGQAVYTVHPRRVALVDPVPVDGGAVVAEHVVDRDVDGVAGVGFDERAGELAVDEDHGLFDAVGGMILAGNVEDVVAGGCLAGDDEVCPEIKLVCYAE